jgi:hypothetical protein
MMIAELSQAIDLHQRCMPGAPEQLTLRYSSRSPCRTLMMTPARCLKNSGAMGLNPRPSA